MQQIAVYTLIISGLFYFSEGKPCPERTRPHKTLCDAYYKCKQIEARRHVWVPEKCEQGLVYEHNLKLCVLPGDDWECLLGDVVAVGTSTYEAPHQEENNNKKMDIYVVSNDDEGPVMTSSKSDRGNLEMVVGSSISSYDEDDNDQYAASGDGGELVELDGFMNIENRETDNHILDSQVHKVEVVDKDGTSSSASKIDPKLTAHLQRLSQLINGLKETYQNKDEEQTELRPDQLNAFLAHFNIKSKFDSLNPSAPADDYKQTFTSSTTQAPLVDTQSVQPLRTASKNKTILQEHLSNKLHPETKVVLTSPSRYDHSGYSNSQIVVNRPEGSVLFRLPSQYGSEAHYGDHATEYGNNSPKISEETLKTVLELSKQMVASQNVPKVVPNPAFYPQPIYPVFLQASNFPGNTHSNPFSSYFNNNNNNNDNDYETDDKLDALSSSYHKPHYHGYKKPSKLRPNNNQGGGYSKPGTTIIHNNLIPVHVTSTNSGEQEVVDSYGQSLGLYPPLSATGGESQSINHHHSHHYQNNKFITSVTTVRPIISTTPASHYGSQYPSQFSTEISLTTPVSTLIADYYTPSPHLNENNVNSVFQTSGRYPSMQYGNIPRPMDLNRPGSSLSSFSSASPSSTYQQVERPQASSSSYYQQTNTQNPIFPAQIDPNKIQIRPNSQKIESMEVETDDISGGYHQRPQHHHQQQQQQQQQVLTYSYSNEKPSVNNQLASSMSYAEPTSTLLSGSSLGHSSSSTNHQHPYLTRHPQVSATGYSTNTNTNTNKGKFPLNAYANDNVQLVNVGGNFIRYDVFQNSIRPLMSINGAQSLNELNANVEVITCATGIRQPNITDCTRYYVCSKKDGKVLSYSCPPYTAFNPQTRICDARTYSYCSPEAIVSSYTVSENKRIQMEALKALQDAKRIRDEALKAQQQNLSTLINQYNGQLQSSEELSGANGNEKDALGTYMSQAASMAFVSSTMKPLTMKKRKYYCKEGDKIPDQTSINSYFVCFKNAQGQMKGHKMTCSKGLVFCPKTTMCTLSSKCS